MTNIKILKNGQNITGLTVSGHSGYAELGKDIVCSAISSLAQSVCVGLENVLNLKPSIKIEDGYLECKLPQNISEDQNQKAQVLLLTFEESVKQILLGDKKFKKYINLEVKNEIY